MSSYPPILFIIFNRPETTARVWEAIRAARPERLYISADGPRPERAGEADRCRAVRAITERIDWPCQVERRYSERNQGCRRAVNAALDWYFECEPEGIVLEDDCLPHPDFFRFAALMLEHYRDNPRIMHINGSNFQNGIRRGDDDLYFSVCASVWGWASWRRAWKKNDPDLKKYDFDAALDRTFADREKRERWRWILRQLRSRNPNFDTWDFQWNASIFACDGLVLTPQENLVTNIGMNTIGTHRMDEEKFTKALSPAGFPATPRFPVLETADAVADDLVFRTFLRRPPLWKRIVGKLRRLFR